jgi:hypothetical protein
MKCVLDQIRQELYLDHEDFSIELRLKLFDAFQMVHACTIEEWFTACESLIEHLIELL